MRLALLLVLVCIAAVLASDSWQYWGNTEFGCSSQSDGQMATYINPQHTSQPIFLELWTFTFSDRNSPVGGMINYWSVSGGPVSKALVNPYLTDGTQSPPSLVVQNEMYSGRSFHALPEGGFDIWERGTDAPVGLVQVQSNSSLVVAGETESASWELLFDFLGGKESWCAADRAQDQLGLSPPQYFSWLFYMPKAVVSGWIELEGVRTPVHGYGESDHPYGAFVPFKTWSAAYLSDGFSTFYWVDFEGRGSFTRFESSVANITTTEFTVSVQTENGNPNRPYRYDLLTDDGTHFIKAWWQATVPGLHFESTVQDVMYGEVVMCAEGEPCVTIAGNGWTEKVVTGSSKSLGLLSRMPEQERRKLLDILNA